MEFSIIQKLLGLTLFGTAWVLWLLIFLSILSVAIMLERFIFFRRMKINFRVFSKELTENLISGDVAAAKTMCERYPAIEAQVALRGFQHWEKGPKAIKESMQGYLIGEKQTLDRGLVVLGTLGNNAPFIGLFGTVIGIIIAFNDLATNPAGGPSVVMSGISEALVATAVGLIVAIPAVVAFNAFNRTVKRRLANAEALMRLIVANRGN